MQRVAASKKTRQAVSLSFLLLALLLVLGSFVLFENDSGSGDATARLSASGVRGIDDGSSDQATAVATPIPSVGVTNSGTIILPVEPEDEGVVITIEPTATPGARIAAAPAVAGLPIVVGLRDGLILSPEALRFGEQTFEIVNQHDQPHRFGVVRLASLDDAPRAADGTLDEAALGDALVGISDAIEPGRSTVLAVTLEPGEHMLISNSLVAGEAAVDAGFAFAAVVVGPEDANGG